MTRVKRGVTAHRRHKKILKQASGYYGARSRTYRSAFQAVIKSHQYSYRDRRNRKRQFRKSWIIKINAASRLYGLKYSQLIYKLRKLSILINRKIIANIVINNPKIFENLIKQIKQ
ncbi:MAG: 50S ribosomal protein L20 [Candidatus Lightella neohaematopini]|nr:50S ribosomal protein L20 [Candidatus Lightella neohaematopini]MCV2531318.1 50S ribosomal protein L20 [Candidatus Lightella neohaematopini]